MLSYDRLLISLISFDWLDERRRLKRRILMRKSTEIRLNMTIPNSLHHRFNFIAIPDATPVNPTI